MNPPVIIRRRRSSIRSGHYIEKCRECGTVTGQCRCPSNDKTVHLVLCGECAAKKAL